MAKRREVMCSDCGKIFKTHSKKRFKCTKCVPKASAYKPQEEGIVFKVTDGHFICRRKNAPGFFEGGTVPVVVSREEKIRVAENSPVTRTRFKQYYPKNVYKKGVHRHSHIRIRP